MLVISSQRSSASIRLKSSESETLHGTMIYCAIVSLLRSKPQDDHASNLKPSAVKNNSLFKSAHKDCHAQADCELETEKLTALLTDSRLSPSCIVSEPRRSISVSWLPANISKPDRARATTARSSLNRECSSSCLALLETSVLLCPAQNLSMVIIRSVWLYINRSFAVMGQYRSLQGPQLYRNCNIKMELSRK